jgi:hypothetical protein
MEHRQAMETPITEEGVRDDAPTAPQMSFGWTFEPLPLAEAMRLARASRMDEAEYAMLREHLTRPRRRPKRVRTDHPTPRRVVPESTESLSQGREASRRGHHRQARPRRTDRLLESHGAGKRDARKTWRCASAQKSTADLGEGNVVEPGGKTQECFHANDIGVTLPS